MKRRRNQDPYFTVARFPSKCAETGKSIKKGEDIAYYPSSRSVFCVESNQAGELRGMQFAESYGMADANW